jgi:phenylacetate-coenzyme A ligase PaaK-like adenylate-forming protein
MINELRDRIFSISSEIDFLEASLKVFDYQFNKNEVYKSFVRNLGKDNCSFQNPVQIPFLPVEFFRDHKIVSGTEPIQVIFESSGTTGSSNPGRHYVTDLNLYEESFLRSFRIFYGEPDEFIILALLPSYTERKTSSLVYMADKLIGMSRNSLSGFYKESGDELLNAINSIKFQDKKVLLLGVSFALLNLAEKGGLNLSGVIIMETGGMKGRRKELTRQELHKILTDSLNVSSIHSEYGMTELLSQAYSKGDGTYYCPPWMKILIRDPQDPLTIYTDTGKTGGINIIDLANINSCSFIATQDLGRLHADGGFEVLGRFDNSDIRGCNLLVE